MGNFLRLIRSPMMRRIWTATLIIVGGFAYLLSEDLRFSNLIVCLIALVFLGIGCTIVIEACKEMTGTPERKES